MLSSSFLASSPSFFELIEFGPSAPGGKYFGVLCNNDEPDYRRSHSSHVSLFPKSNAGGIRGDIRPDRIGGRDHGGVRREQRGAEGRSARSV